MSGHTTKKEAGFKITQLFNFQMKSNIKAVCVAEIIGSRNCNCNRCVKKRRGKSYRQLRKIKK